jgi:amino acid transporter
VSALLVLKAGSSNTLSVFVPGEAGFKPAIQGMVFCLLAFVGFEAAAPLGEEARDPKRTVRQAVIWSCVGIGIFYTFCYYAATVFFGPDKMTGFITANDGNPWGGMADSVLPGIGSLIVTFAILNSCLANASSGATAATRAIFSLGRTGLIPRAFAAIHPTYRTPVNAVHIQAAFGVVLAVALSLWLGAAYPAVPGPENTYFFLGYALGLLFAGMYMAVNIAVIGYYLRDRREEFNVLRHVVVPVIGFVMMIPAFISTLGGIYIPIADFTPSALAEPYNIVPLLVAIWMVIGVVVGVVFQTRQSDRMVSLGEAVAEA